MWAQKKAAPSIKAGDDNSRDRTVRVRPELPPEPTLKLACRIHVVLLWIEGVIRQSQESTRLILVMSGQRSEMSGATWPRWWHFGLHAVSKSAGTGVYDQVTEKYLKAEHPLNSRRAQWLQTYHGKQEKFHNYYWRSREHNDVSGARLEAFRKELRA